jgi:hypothetical protein
MIWLTLQIEKQNYLCIFLLLKNEYLWVFDFFERQKPRAETTTHFSRLETKNSQLPIKRFRFFS